MEFNTIAFDFFFLNKLLTCINSNVKLILTVAYCMLHNGFSPCMNRFSGIVFPIKINISVDI